MISGTPSHIVPDMMELPSHGRFRLLTHEPDVT